MSSKLLLLLHKRKKSAPSLDLNFASGVFPAGLTFTRNTTATYFDSTGTLQFAAVNVPRIGYDPATLLCQGFLSEENRTNILLNSNVPVTQNCTVNAAPWTLSIYGSGTIVMSGAFSGTLTGTGSFPTTRTSLTFTPTAGVLTLTITGTGDAGQLEAGLGATSYIPTLSSPVGRGPDVCNIATGAWYNANAISLVTEIQVPAIDPNNGLGLSGIDDGTFSNRIQIGISSSGIDFEAYAAGTGVPTASTSGLPVPTLNTPFKTGITYGPLGSSVTTQGATTSVRGGATAIPTVTKMDIGNFTGAYQINGFMRRLQYWPRILSPAELQAATVVPVTGPTLDLNFTDGSTFNPAIVFTRASVGTYFDNTGTLQTAAVNTPRIDFGPSPGANPLGLLIEEGRTNSLRNPRCEGAVPGTPGTLPTDWTSSGLPAGLSMSVIGTGTESGIPYVDIRWFGSSVTAGSFGVIFESSNFVATTVAKTWTASVYQRVVGGAIPSGGLQARQQMQCADSSNAQTEVLSGTTAVPTTAGLATQRQTVTGTTAVATTAFIASRYLMTAPSGAMDITIRLGVPQLELGSVATTVILPVVGTPAASTRASDNANMPSAFWVAGSGTLVGEVNCYGANPVNTQNVCQLDSGSNANRAILRQATGGNLVACLVVSGNTVEASLNTGPITLGSPFKLGMSWSAGAQTSAVNGTFGANATGALNPVSITTLRIGNNGSLGEYTNGWSRRIRYWPRALPSAELIAQTV